jgi:hypothetical protein
MQRPLFEAVGRSGATRPHYQGGRARADAMDSTVVTSPRLSHLPLSCFTKGTNQQLEAEARGGVAPFPSAPRPPVTTAQLSAQESERPADPDTSSSRAAGNSPALRRVASHGAIQYSSASAYDGAPRVEIPDWRGRGHDGPNSRHQRASGWNSSADRGGSQSPHSPQGIGRDDSLIGQSATTPDGFNSLEAAGVENPGRVGGPSRSPVGTRATPTAHADQARPRGSSEPGGGDRRSHTPGHESGDIPSQRNARPRTGATSASDGPAAFHHLVAPTRAPVSVGPACVDDADGSN